METYENLSDLEFIISTSRLSVLYFSNFRGDSFHGFLNIIRKLWKNSVELISSVLTLQKNFGTARKQMVRVPKKKNSASFTRLFFYRANHSENHVLVGCWAQGFGQHTRTYRSAHVELFRQNGGLIGLHFLLILRLR